MVKEREKKDLPRNHEKIVCLKNHSTRDALFKSHRGRVVCMSCSTKLGRHIFKENSDACKYIWSRICGIIINNLHCPDMHLSLEQCQSPLSHLLQTTQRMLLKR